MEPRDSAWHVRAESGTDVEIPVMMCEAARKQRQRVIAAVGMQTVLVVPILATDGEVGDRVLGLVRASGDWTDTDVKNAVTYGGVLDVVVQNRECTKQQSRLIEMFVHRGLRLQLERDFEQTIAEYRDGVVGEVTILFADIQQSTSTLRRLKEPNGGRWLGAVIAYLGCCVDEE
jgi:hypothetical protein